MKILKPLFVLFFFISAMLTYSATIVDGITQKSYDNVLKTYNFTYWDSSFKPTPAAVVKFSNQTSSYNLSVNYSTLSINSLSVNTLTNLPSAAFSESVATTFSTTQTGNIDYKILKNGAPLYEKPTTSPTNLGPKIGQLAEYGTWCNRRVIDSLNFTNAPSVYGSFTGIEFTNWHNRFKITFRLKPRVSITNGQLQLSVQLPTVYATLFNTGNIYGFAKSATGEGFAVKGGSTCSTASVTGTTIQVKTSTTTLMADSSYQVSLIFYPVKTGFSSVYATTPDDLEEATITATQSLPDNTTKVPVVYNNDEGMYIIDVPNYTMGYGDCATADMLQNIKLQIVNNLLKDKRVRLCFRQISSLNIVGFSSMLRNPNGDPSGVPLQISKDWHGAFTDMLYAGTWIKEYTEILVPASTTLNFDYTRIGAKWGTVYGAFSHQLSVVGSGVPRGGWLQAGIGSFGENITHSPDYEFGNANICDYRPFLTTNQAYGGTSTACNWTGNVGGMDMWIYKNSSNTRIYQSQVKTRFKKYGPNLTETSVSAYSSDNKLKLDYTFYLNRSDDYTRVYYKLKIKALQATTFTRFDIFQMGSDNYNLFKAQSIAYGDSSGVIKQFLPTNSPINDYTTPATALTGVTPWIWAGDGMYSGTPGGINTNTNNGLIIKSYTASFGGKVNNTPYFRERVSSTVGYALAGQNPTSYCLVPPPTVTSFAVGDSVEVLLETCILPKQYIDYYGSNTNFIAALSQYGNTWQLLYREAKGNATIASSATNVINNSYPLTVKTIGNTADVTIKKGIGYVPVVFRGLTSITSPKLWWLNNNVWDQINQSNKGNDFWQADFDPETGLFDVIYNVNQDIVNNGTATIRYFLGNTPPILTSLTEIKSESLDIKIYPNPTKGRCSITTENERIESVRIFNTLGIELTKQIKPIGLNTTKVKLDLSTFTPNRYILKVNNYNSVIVVE
jgi:Secretion system C-terminal sorting domain